MTTDDRIEDALNFLAKEQTAGQAFNSWSYPDSQASRKAKRYQTIFSNALILSSLADCQHQLANKIKKGLVNFLLSQERRGSYNYWVRGSPASKTHPYPDDFDDTACALAAMYLTNSSLVSSLTLKNFLVLLTTYETKPGGPYQTWVANQAMDKRWRDVDLAVNSNIGYFLSLLNVSLPNITRLIEKAIAKKVYRSPYYPNEFPIFYFISRFYNGSKKSAIIQAIFERQQADGSWGSPLKTALAISALLNFEVSYRELKKAVAYLEKSQKSGHWPAEAFCLDPSINGQKHYSGSPALTTALVVETLSKYRAAAESWVATPRPSEKEELFQAVKKEALVGCSPLKSPLKQQARRFIIATLNNDRRQEIALFPYFFWQATQKTGSQLPQPLLVQLGVANLYGWIAYDLYDDLIDQETRLTALPLANFFARELTLHYAALNATASFRAVLNEMDLAYWQEAANGRFDPNNLTALKRINKQTLGPLKSLGHALGPLVIIAAGHPRQAAELTPLIKRALRHYLVARQLMDDAHDWEEDLLAGRLTAIGQRLLTKPFSPEKTISQLLPNLRKTFWRREAEIIFSQVLFHLAKARRDFAACPIVRQTEPLEIVFSHLEKAAQEGLISTKRSRALINAFA